MRSLFVLCVASILVVSVIGEEVKTVTDLVKWINNDDKQWQKALACFLDKEPCGELQPFRDNALHIAESKCRDCSQTEKEMFANAQNYIKTKYPKIYQELIVKYNYKE